MFSPSILKTSSTTDPAAFRSTNKTKSIVRFDCLIIKEFPIELGDNVPRTGAPVIMSQTACRSLVINLEHFESIRPPRRHRNSLILTTAARTERLLSAGHSLEEIAHATLTAYSIRVSRGKNNEQGICKFAQSTVGRVLTNMMPFKNQNPAAARIAKLCRPCESEKIGLRHPLNSMLVTTESARTEQQAGSSKRGRVVRNTAPFHMDKNPAAVQVLARSA
jgi:hypothetical protein